MGERKVIQKYYPPDFDPSKLPKRSINKQQKSRTMLPMSIRCNTCGEYIGLGTKFNSKHELASENYLGIKIHRFYSKCKNCSAEFTTKTDPRNTSYIVEAGASRNYEPWREEGEELERVKRKRDAEELGDPMKCMENKAGDMTREMGIMSGLEEEKSRKSRHEKVGYYDLSKALPEAKKAVEQKLDDSDELVIKSSFPVLEEVVKRIGDGEWDGEDDCTQRRRVLGKKMNTSSKPVAIKIPEITFKVKKKQDEKENVEKFHDDHTGSSVIHSLAQYDSEDN